MTFLQSIGDVGIDAQVAIFEDCGYGDSTRTILKKISHSVGDRPDLLAEHRRLLHSRKTGDLHTIDVFLGSENLGVAGNSNRAIKWFNETNADHLLLCNDDLIALGDFPKEYARFHAATAIDLFCFCDFRSEEYKWTIARVKSLRLKVLRRMTGIMMSWTRKGLDKVGYFETLFKKFHEEHCEITVRARMAGLMDVSGKMTYCLDIDPDEPVLAHQEISSCMTDDDKLPHAHHASIMMAELSKSITCRDPHTPFTLKKNVMSDGYAGHGTQTHRMVGYHSL